LIKSANTLLCKIYVCLFLELGTMEHTCEDDLVCRNTNEKIPYFNAPVYLENKQQIGKVDEIFGSITESVSFNVHIIHNSKDNKYITRFNRKHIIKMMVHQGFQYFSSVPV
jgi:rRNA processing protein Gar1